MKYLIEQYIIIKYNSDYSYIFLKKREKKNARIIRLNEIGKVILKLLEEGREIEDILEYILKNYEELPNRNKILQDINAYVKSLKMAGVIKAKDFIEKDTSMQSQYIESNLSFVKELEKIQKKYHSEEKPYKVFIELTYQCNLKCIHCYRQEHVYNATKKTVFLSKEKILELFDEFEENGVVEVYITGGEPFLHPDIYEILKYGSRKNFLLSVFTNGNSLSDIQNIMKIKKCHFMISEFLFMVWMHDMIALHRLLALVKNHTVHWNC